MRVLDLFAGIGGFTLGLERAGFETVAFCEIEPYAQKVLRKNWPEVPIYDDVRTITAERLISDGIGVDVITGGFPCQDISVAGNQAGIQDGTRSGLWTECARLLGELQPKYAIFENVTNLLNGERGAWFKRVLWDISALGYDAEWHCIPASELGAHHHRDRVWIICYPREVLLEDSRYSQWRYSQSTAGRQDAQTERECDTGSVERSSKDVAYPNRGDDTRINGSASQGSGKIAPKGTEHAGRRSGEQNVADTDNAGNRTPECEANGFEQEAVERRNEQPQFESSRLSQNLGFAIRNSSEWIAESDVGRVAHGVPDRTHRLKCLGNAVVPPIPELIGRAIKKYEL